jgi:hypothetical protein
MQLQGRVMASYRNVEYSGTEPFLTGILYH